MVETGYNCRSSQAIRQELSIFDEDSGIGCELGLFFFTGYELAFSFGEGTPVDICDPVLRTSAHNIGLKNCALYPQI